MPLAGNATGFGHVTWKMANLRSRKKPPGSAIFDHRCGIVFKSMHFAKKRGLSLITTYFTPAEQIALCARLGLPEPSSVEISEIRQNADAYKDSLKKGARFQIPQRRPSQLSIHLCIDWIFSQHNKRKPGRSSPHSSTCCQREQRSAQWVSFDT